MRVVHRGRPVEGFRPVESVNIIWSTSSCAEVVVPVADMQPKRGGFCCRQCVYVSVQGKKESPQYPQFPHHNPDPDRVDCVVIRTDVEFLESQLAHGQRLFKSVALGDTEHSHRLHRHRAAPDLAPAVACDIGHPADGGGGVRHVDGHRVGAGAVVRAVVHREGEGRIGVAVRIARGREGEHVSVDLGLGDDVVRHDRRAVERQRARRRHGHDRHARQRGAGVVIVEAEVVRREGVRPVLARRHRLVGRRRRGVGGCRRQPGRRARGPRCVA